MGGRSAIWLAVLLARPVLSSGLVGYGIYPYDPPCAFSCHRSLSPLALSCTPEMEATGHMHMDMTPPDCRAGNTAWLTTLAWCMRSQCAEFAVVPSELEAFWESQSTGDPSVPPKWSYAAALQNVTETPTQTLTAEEEHLHSAALVNPEVYESQYNALTAVQRENEVESTYAIALLVTGFGTPIVLTWLSYFPYMSRVLGKIKPYLVYPSTIGTYQVRPLPFRLGNAPTLGQGLYIAGLFALTVILSAANYQTKQPHAWFESLQKEVTAYVFYRTGYLAFALTPLVFLFATRNNVLLWLSNWSHSTFLLLHRWVSRIFGLLVILHTLLALPLYYPKEANEKYWIWGAVATIAVMLLIVGSGLYVRSASYEVFLVSHILLAVFVVVGCWYHIQEWIGLTWGYETWLYATCAVWFFDRLARAGRVLKTGLRRAQVTDLGSGFVRVDVPGVRWGAVPGRHVCTYFPTLRPLRPWENHPFSVLETAMLQNKGRSAPSGGESPSTEPEQLDMEKQGRVKVMVAAERKQSAGLTLFIKKTKGMTQYLQAHHGLPVLLDGPYPNGPTKEVLQCDRLLLLGGGIGITSLLPWASHHWNVRLCWSVKESARCLVDALEDATGGIEEKDVRVGSRLSMTQILAEEAEAGWNHIGVVVSGPGGFCDDARQAVVVISKTSKARFELEVEAYSW